jgi:hypothetical protein
LEVIMVMADPTGGDRQQARKPGRVIPFGKYLLLERIAVGGMAEVYMSKSFGIEGFEKILAIKRILPTMAEDSDFIEMFVDEAKIAGQLTHANIAPIYELGKIGDSHYIAMEYVWGKDLLQIMNRFRRLRKKMPAAMVAWIAAKMSEALDYAHQKRDRRGTPLNIIHRDVSPQNVLVSYEGEVKLIDFGIAKAASRTTKTQAGVLKGKFGYMSPEQVRGLPIDPRSDIFAVGTCMYEMLTAERLFMGESDFSTLEKVRNADVSPITHVVRDCPPELGTIVMRALSKEPSDRYGSAGELQEVLMTFLARERPPFGTSKLAAWMKTAFATEMAREKARLDSFAQIGRPSVLGGPRKPPGPVAVAPAPAPVAPRVPRPGPVTVGTDELDAGDLESVDEGIEGEATMLTASPFENEAVPLDAIESIDEEEMNAQPTQIFFSAEDEAAAPKAPLGSMPAQPMFASPAPTPSFSAAQPGFAPAAPAFTPPPHGHPPSGGGHSPSVQVDPKMVQSSPGMLSPNQRGVHTVEIRADQVPPAEKSGGGKMVVLFALAALVMLAIGAGAVWVLMGGTGDPVGTIEVRTVPPVAASVRIDGLGRGTAPLRIDRMPVGEHVIDLEAEGFEATQRRVVVNDGTVAMLEVALVRTSATPSDIGAVAANTATNPENAAGAPSTPTPEAAAAEAEAEAEREREREREEERARAAEREEETERGSTERPASTSSSSSMEESSSSSRRAPSTEGTSTASSTSTTRRRETSTSTSTMEESTETEEAPRTPRPVRVEAEEEGGDAAFGTLVINSLPWARVFIDGRDTGRNTPVPSLRVRAGRREIGLRTPDGVMHNYTEEVPPGGTVRVMKRL